MKIFIKAITLFKYYWRFGSFPLISILVILCLTFCELPVSGQQMLVPANMLICVGCGSKTPSGTKDVDCASINDYECAGIKDDLGNEVKVWCVNKSFYACLYTPKNGLQRYVGRCPFGGGRNSVQLFVLPDNNHNGKWDYIQGTIWISHDGPKPGEWITEWDPVNQVYKKVKLTVAKYFKDHDQDNDKKFDRWVYTYKAFNNEVKQENVECTAYQGSTCSTVRTVIKSPIEDCFQAGDLEGPFTGESRFISTHMVFPDDILVSERFVINLAHAEVAVQPEREMHIREFLELFVAEMQENCYLSRLVGIRPEYHYDEEQQQHVVTLPCVDPQEVAIREADRSLQRLAPVRNLEAIYERESGVRLMWEPGDEYDAIVVWRNGNRITDYYSVEMNYFIDDFKSSPLDFLRQEMVYGIYTYTVFGIRDGIHSIARDVEVNVRR